MRKKGRRKQKGEQGILKEERKKKEKLKAEKIEKDQRKKSVR